MKFTIQKKPLAQMLRALAKDSGKKKAERDSHLRLSAKEGVVSVRANDTEAGCEAVVFEEGVCFFRYAQFLPLIRSYAGEKKLTIEITPDGIQIGNTNISRGFWEVSLFTNPATAPETLPKPPTKEANRKRGQQEVGF